jgi:hypothetical protein
MALEGFADSFEQVASSDPQQDVAEEFRQFVTGLPGLMMAAAAKQEEELAEAIFGRYGSLDLEAEGGLPQHSREAGRER